MVYSVDSDSDDGRSIGETRRENAPPDEADPLNTFKILVASDIHLGFCDTNSGREDDSFNTFEEVLEIAVEEEVDFVLLGGDLFHENKPKPGTLQRAIDILRKHCLGDRPVGFQYCGEPTLDFKNMENPTINYENENINVGLPVFTIHGNHDDPVGSRKVSAVDHLASAGLLNHFGQYDSLNEVEIRPLLLKKGTTNLALYGLGCMKDERLFRLFRDRKVKFLREAKDMDQYFNLFVLHQNRVKHGTKNYIPPNFFPHFLQLVIWGHEHECKIEPEQEITATSEGDDNFCFVSQPGSTVATSLCPGEKETKKVGILYIHGSQCFQMKPRALKTVRPFLSEDLYTSEILVKNERGRDNDQFLEDYVAARVRQLIEDAADQLTGHPKQPVNPLIRIRIGYDDESELFNPVRFSQRFAQDVANDDIIMFKKCPRRTEKLGKMDVADLQDMIMEEEEHDLEGHVEEIVETYFTVGRQNDERDRILEILSEKGLSEAVKACVEKNDTHAIDGIVNVQIQRVTQHLQKKNVTDETIEDELKAFREARNLAVDQELEEDRRHMARIEKLNKNKKGAHTSILGGNDVEDETRNNSRVQVFDIDDDENGASSDEDGGGISPPAPTRGRGRGSRGPRGARARGGAASSARGSRASTRAASRGSRSRLGF